MTIATTSTTNINYLTPDTLTEYNITSLVSEVTHCQPSPVNVSFYNRQGLKLLKLLQATNVLTWRYNLTQRAATVETKTQVQYIDTA